jgi:hypothetical protein
MSKFFAQALAALVLFLLLGAVFVTGAFGQQTPFFTPGNLVVSVEGCGVQGGTCTSVPNGTGNGAGNSSVGGYGDNQGSLFTLFQYTPNGTSSTAFVNSLVLPQTGSGANLPVSAEYGSSSEGTLQLSGGGQYLTIMGYGVNANAFNANPTSYGVSGGELAQSGSLTGQSYTPVPRVVTLIDPYGNVNSSTGLFNIFNTNNPRSTYTVDGTHFYVSGQGSGSDATSGVFYTTLGSSSATSITGADAGSGASQDTRDVQIYNNTLYVSMDSKSGAYNRSYIGTLGSPPATSVFSCTGVGAGCPTGDGTIGPALMAGFGNTGGTGREKLTAAQTNGINVSGEYINLSPENYFFASPTVLYVADSGSPKNTSAENEAPTAYSTCGAGGLQKWVNISGTWTWEYTLYEGLNLVKNANSDSTSTCSTNTSGTTGLLGLTGVVVGNSVQLYATTYTIADLDPSYLYGITDVLSATTNPGGETFTQLAAAPPDSNFKGVALAPTLPAGSATITSSPSGLAFTSSGTGCAPGTYTTPVTLTWTPNSSCSLSVSTPQVALGTQYVFSQWGDGTTSTTDVVTAPTTSATYTANFTPGASGIYSPTPNSSLTGSSATFQWYGPPQTAAFWIDVGSTAGAHDYYSSGSLPTSTLSATVSGLPTNGSSVYVTLYWMINGSWTPNPYTFTAFNASSKAATLTTPAPGSTLTGSSLTFGWTAGSGSSAYWLDVGSAPNGNSYYSSGNLGSALSTTVNGLPTNGSTIYVTLYSLVSGTWTPGAYSYTALNPAAAGGVLTSPAPGSILPGNSVTFGWSAGSGASGYWLDIGSTSGGHDYYSSGNLGNVLSKTVNGLPTDGSAVYATLYSLIGGQWFGNTYNYTAFSATSGLAVMQSPGPGSTLSGNVVTFNWSVDPNATAYWVDVSTVDPGGNDLDSSGNLGNVQTETIYNLPANGSTIYVTLYSYAGGQWLSTASTYTSGP